MHGEVLLLLSQAQMILPRPKMVSRSPCLILRVTVAITKHSKVVTWSFHLRVQTLLVFLLYAQHPDLLNMVPVHLGQSPDTLTVVQPVHGAVVQRPLSPSRLRTIKFE